MSNADDRCVFVLLGGPCGVWRDTHPMIPFKPEFHHPFVDPPIRPIGDEAKVRDASSDIPVLEILNRFSIPCPGVSVGTNDRIVIAVRESFTAGRADADKSVRRLLTQHCDCNMHPERSIICSACRVLYDLNARRGSEGT